MRKSFDHGLSLCGTSLTCTVQHMMHIEQVSIALDDLCWRLYKQENRKWKKFSRILGFQYIDFKKHTTKGDLIYIPTHNNNDNKTPKISQTTDPIPNYSSRFIHDFTQATSRNTTKGKRNRIRDRLVADYGLLLLLLFGGGEDPPPLGSPSPPSLLSPVVVVVVVFLMKAKVSTVLVANEATTP